MTAATQPCAGPPGEPPEIVVFAPLPPTRNGIADYAHELLGAMARHARLLAVVEDASLPIAAPPGVHVIGAAAYARAPGRYAALPHLWHLGNNPDHVYMLPHMAGRRGVVVLHETNLHYLLDCATLARNDQARYAAALEAEHGAPGALLARQFLDFGLREPAMQQDMPMIGLIAQNADAVIVHSRYAASKVLARAPATPVHVINHHCRLPAAEPPGRAALRRQIGVPDSAVLFLSLGFASANKQIDRAIRALAAIRGEIGDFRYVIAGALRPEEVDLPAITASAGLADRVIFLGYVPEDDFFGLINAADILLNLRHPPGGETSGTLIRALGAGACAVVVDRGAFAELPDDAVVKLPWDEGFDRRLQAALRALAADPPRRQAIGRAARAHIARQHDLAANARRYLEILAETRGTSRPPLAVATGFAVPPPRALAGLEARASAAGIDPPDWFRAGLLPLPAPSGLLWTHGATAADLACARLLGHAPREADPAPASVDLALHGLGDAADAAALAALHRGLRYGGLALILADATRGPGSALLHLRPGTDLLRRYGFAVQESLATTPIGADGMPRPPGNPGRAWRVAKISDLALTGMPP